MVAIFIAFIARPERSSADMPGSSAGLRDRGGQSALVKAATGNLLVRRLVAGIASAARLGAAELDAFLAGSNCDVALPSPRPT